MKYLIKNKDWEINKDYNLDKLLYLLIDRANRSNRFGDIAWYNNEGVLHRNYALPAAVVWWDNSLMWRINGK